MNLKRRHELLLEKGLMINIAQDNENKKFRSKELIKIKIKILLVVQNIGIRYLMVISIMLKKLQFL